MTVGTYDYKTKRVNKKSILPAVFLGSPVRKEDPYILYILSLIHRFFAP